MGVGVSVATSMLSAGVVAACAATAAGAAAASNVAMATSAAARGDSKVRPNMVTSQSGSQAHRSLGSVIGGLGTDTTNRPTQGGGGAVRVSSGLYHTSSTTGQNR